MPAGAGNRRPFLAPSAHRHAQARDYVSRHADTKEQKRLHNTLITFSVLHTYYRVTEVCRLEALYLMNHRIGWRLSLLRNSRE